MKISLPVLLIILLFQTSFAQNFTGQWKGSFTDKSSSFVGWGGNKCEYIIDLDCKDRVVSGYSYTYFNEGGKRFYTICRLKGSFDKGSKSVEITEVERTKTNVPNNIRNCFQVHRLTYFKQGEDEILEGSWVPAPKQEGDCGYGTTTLNKRILKKNATLFNNSSALSSKPAPNNKPKTTTPPVVRSIPQNSPTPLKVKPVIPDNAKVQTPKITANNELPKMDHNPAVNKEVAKGFDFQFEKRNNTLIRTIEIENETFRVDLYDNGEIDGDSISLIFNGKLLFAHKRLSDKALSLNLNIDDDKDVNELVMYADNLGSIPPNTALMVVTDGNNRYEVRISSDLQKSGSIRFIHKPKPGQ